jgi:diguanylate cyclase (GGDEF)-like protein
MSQLPRGGELPYEDFKRRHRAITSLLAICAVALAIWSLVEYPFLHSALDLSPLVACLATSHCARLGRRGQGLAAAVGLMTAAALGVHLSGGWIEAHFTFFIFVGVLALYEDWLVFGGSVVYTLLHHGVMGSLTPHMVYRDPAQYDHPWRWAGIHAAFLLGAAVVGVIGWRVNEDIRRRMRRTQDALHAMATTDALTGLRNRRQLMDDLDEAVRTGAEATLLLADLNGFKGYNDMFGHPAGDALLKRLASRLKATFEGDGHVYRLGGDEFCALLTVPGQDAPQLQARCDAALREQGEAFDITASVGAVRLLDSVDPAHALLSADQHMYAHKSSRASAFVQTKDVLLSVLSERNVELAQHINQVAELAEMTARHMDLDEETVAAIRHAAELHDVGKVAVPDAILSKPGKLDQSELEFMRQHTIVGERIAGAAPALAYVARLVRSTHERHDGGGYPDGLAGDDIPLGAQVVFVCDAFDAMTSDRPYSAALCVEDALVELRRCSGTQFRPEVVDAFTAAWALRQRTPAALAA